MASRSAIRASSPAASSSAYDAVTDEAWQLTLANITDFFTDRFYLRSLWNSPLLGTATVATTSVLGIAIAFLLVRYDFRGRDLFGYLTIIPIISPPLVGVLGFTFILGRAGTVNVLLMDHFDVLRPVDFLYGLHGVVLVETFHLFPMIALNVVDALGKIDPALEEAADSVGARPWRRFWTVTLPLCTPGTWRGRCSSSSGRSRTSRRRSSSACRTCWRPRRTCHRRDAEVHREQLSVLGDGGRALRRAGRSIAWLLARSDIPGLGALDALNTLILAVPGTAIGIAYIRAFHFDLPGFDRGLTSFWIAMPLVLAVRRLPYTVRGSHASLLLVHRSMEEAAASVVATGLRSFRDITLPLIWKGILVGALFSFMTSLQEASAVLFLALGGWETITNGIFAFYIAGSANEAAALGVILIAVAAVTTVVINRAAGARMVGVFG